MREVVDAERIHGVLRDLGDAAPVQGRAFVTGGTTAVLLGWRATTIDIDLKFVPEQDALLRAVPALKERRHVNIELASPADFIPVPQGWEERSRFIEEAGRLAFYHFDLYAQAMAKVERGHAKDIGDVEEMVRRGLIDPDRALEYFRRLEPDLYRFPAIDPTSFREAVTRCFGGAR